MVGEPDGLAVGGRRTPSGRRGGLAVWAGPRRIELILVGSGGGRHHVLHAASSSAPELEGTAPRATAGAGGGGGCDAMRLRWRGRVIAWGRGRGG